MTITAKDVVLFIDDQVVPIPNLAEQLWTLDRTYEGPPGEVSAFFRYDRQTAGAEVQRRLVNPSAAEEKVQAELQEIADSLQRLYGYQVTVDDVERIRERLGLVEITDRLSDAFAGLSVYAQNAAAEMQKFAGLFGRKGTPVDLDPAPRNRAQRRRAAYEQRRRMRRG